MSTDRSAAELVLEDVGGDVYLWVIDELDAETAIRSIAKTLGYHFDAKEDAKAVRDA